MEISVFQPSARFISNWYIDPFIYLTSSYLIRPGPNLLHMNTNIAKSDILILKDNLSSSLNWQIIVIPSLNMPEEDSQWNVNYPQKPKNHKFNF